MRINFVTETKSQSWILRPLAECLANNIPSAAVSTEVATNVKWNVFFNYALYKPCSTFTAAFFTHQERNGMLRKKFRSVAEQVDWCFAQSYNTLQLLPQHKTSYLETYPTRPQYYHKVTLGICGRRYSSGRKRMKWATELSEIPGIEVKITDGKIPADAMPDWYRSIDYLLVTSDNEGGPQPVLEALAMGVPVIAPNVGYCWQYPGLRYETKKQLFELVEALVVPPDGWRQSAKEMLECLQSLIPQSSEATIP